MDLLGSGVDVATVAMWLGHEKLDSVNPYIHADLAMKERALDQTGAAEHSTWQVPPCRRSARLPRSPLIMPRIPARAPR